MTRFDREAVSKSQDSSIEADDEFDVMGDIFHVWLFACFSLCFRFTQNHS